MTGVALNFNAASVTPRQTLDPLPSGWYNARITNTSMKPTSKPGGQMLELELSIIDGPFQNRKVFDRLNLVNENPQAVQIAYETLSQICGAAGIAGIQQSTAELHNLPLKVKVKLRPAETGADGKQYDAGNEVKGYDHINSDRAVVAAPVVGGVAGAPAGVPAWATGAPAAPAQAAPAAYAPPAAPAPAVAPPAAFTPPAAAQPWEQPAAAPVAAPPPQPFTPPPPVQAAPPAGPVMLPAAGATPYEAYRAAGWSDEQLIASGYMAAPVQAAPVAAPPPPAPAVAPPPPAAGPVPATPPGGAPPWARPGG